MLDAKIYKIPITPTEYFLIENRQQDFAGDGLHLTKGASGVVLEADDYDVDIPGSGLLIWHIDERIIAAGLRNYCVNADPYMRGVDLEEADGSQDIGESFPGLLPGVLSPENGLEWDAFYAGICSMSGMQSDTCQHHDRKISGTAEHYRLFWCTTTGNGWYTLDKKQTIITGKI